MTKIQILAICFLILWRKIFFDSLEENIRNNITLVYKNIVNENCEIRFDDISGIIIGGSEYNLSAGNESYWIEKLKKYIFYAYANQLPLLGVCFGHQLIAESFGGKIKNKRPRELGTVNIQLTPEGKKDLLFKGFNQSIDVIMSHQDIVADNSEIISSLAYNPFCNFQAIAVGKVLRGIQFHPDATKEKIEQQINRWHNEFRDEGINIDEVKKNLKDTPKAKLIFNNFANYYILKN